MKNELSVVVVVLNVDIEVSAFVVVAVNVSQNENRQKTGNAEYRRKVFPPKNDFEKMNHFDLLEL
jgi:hypothetical protein